MSIELHGPAWAWAALIAYVVVVAPIFSAMGEEVYRRWRADREARRWR